MTSSGWSRELVCVMGVDEQIGRCVTSLQAGNTSGYLLPPVYYRFLNPGISASAKSE